MVKVFIVLSGRNLLINKKKFEFSPVDYTFYKETKKVAEQGEAQVLNLRN